MNCMRVPGSNSRREALGPRRFGLHFRGLLLLWCFAGGGLSARAGRNDVDIGPVARALLVLHLALDQREEREVAPHPDVAARMHPGADLADEDVSGDDPLAAEHLHSAVLPR